MAKVSYRLRGKSSIYIRFTAGRGKSFEKRTNLTIAPNKWSEKTGMPKTRNATAEDKNLKTTLEKLSTFIYENFNKAIEQGNDVTGKWLQHQLDVFFGVVDETGVSNKVTDHIKEIIRTAKTRENTKGGIGISKDRVQKYKLLAEVFKEFQGNKNYKIKDLSKIVFDKFRTWLLETKKYAPSTAYKKVRDLKTVCLDAMAKGIEVSPTLHGVKVGVLKTYDKETDIITLSFEEIEKIETLVLTKDSLINARKWLILACYTGQRGGDLMKLKQSDFKYHRGKMVIDIVQGKGNKPVTIPALPKVQKVYDEGLPYPISLQKLSDYFKELGKLAEINTPTMGLKRINGRGVKKLRPKYEYLSTHVGRRSFATNHYGILETPFIMAVTGHSREDTFFRYINKKGNPHLDAFFDYYDKKNVKMKVVKGGKSVASN